MKTTSTAVTQPMLRAWLALPSALTAGVVLSLCTPAWAGSGTVQVSMAGAEHVDGLGSPSNTVRQVIVPEGAVIQGVGWSGVLTTVGESWASDADIAISDGTNAPPMIFTPAEGVFASTPPSGTFFTSGGVVSFGSLGQPGYPIQGGVVYIEFSDSFIDNPGSVEAFWGGSSMLTLQYDIVPMGKCPADINGDTFVDVSDLLLLFGAWGSCPSKGSCPADLNGDTFVDVSDLLLLFGAWGACPPTSDLQSACCLGDGSCQNLTRDECLKHGGMYQGDFTLCSSWQCPQPPDGTTCEQAMTVEVGGPTKFGNTTGTQPPDWLPFCQIVGVPPSNTGIMWFKVEGNGSYLTARTCASAIETDMAVYCGQACDAGFLSCITSSFEGDCSDNIDKATLSWCSVAGRPYYIAVWGWAGSFGEVALSIEDDGECSNPPACELPCDGYCNSFSPAGCWCDEVLCQIFGNCCPGMCASCPQEPSCDDGCPPAQCPSGATQEGESCGASMNNGCNVNSQNPPMGSISCGQTICGTVWADNGTRDTDWYELDLTGHTQFVQVTVNVQSDVNLFAYVLEEGCPPVAIYGQEGCEINFSICLEPGRYTVLIQPATFFGLPCSQGPHRYNVSVSCAAGCAATCAGWCGLETPEGCWCDEECWIWGDCCPDVCAECPTSGGC